MKLKQALEIVVSLARENIPDARDVGGSEEALKDIEMSDRACDTVDDFIEHMCGDHENSEEK